MSTAHPSSAPSYAIRAADLSRPWDRAAVVALLDGYAREPVGGGRPLAPEVTATLADRLAGVPGARIWLAIAATPDAEDEPAGIAVAFVGFSTFAARPLLNLHDLAVAPAHRRRRVARRLLAAVEDAARALGCCKITLEVRDDNPSAQRLYRAVGYADGGAPHRFLTKPL